MFTNRPGCTIYERTIQDRAPVFVRRECGPVYWEDTYSQQDGSDRAPQNSAFIVIPATSTDYCPKQGDKIVGEIIADENPPANAITVMTVKDFRYGSPKVQHIEVTAQ